MGCWKWQTVPIVAVVAASDEFPLSKSTPPAGIRRAVFSCGALRRLRGAETLWTARDPRSAVVYSLACFAVPFSCCLIVSPALSAKQVANEDRLEDINKIPFIIAAVIWIAILVWGIYKFLRIGRR